MASSLHSLQTVSDGIHIAHSLEFADATARGAYSATAADVGRVARQLDTDEFYILADHSPLTWKLLTATAVDHVLSHAIGEDDGEKIGNQTYTAIAHMIWRGSTSLGTPSNVRVKARRSGGSSDYDIRLYDVTNALQIAEVTAQVNDVFAIIDLGTLSNISAGEAMWEVQGKVGDGSTEGRLAAVVAYL